MLTKEEEIILFKSAEIWNEFTSLEQTHPEDVNDIADAVNSIQKTIAIRLARRTAATSFVTVK